MKNKIIVIVILIAIIINMFNFVNANSVNQVEDLKEYFTNNKTFTFVNYSGETKEITLPDFEENFFKDTYSQYHDYLGFYDSPNNNVYFLFNNINDGSVSLNSNDCFYFRESGSVYNFRDYIVYDITNKTLKYSNFCGSWGWSIGSFENAYYCSNTTVYLYKDADETFEILYTPADDTIGDPNSDLQLSYQYNEDYTSCHIDATIKGGAFTDKIYYSNYQPGITGELLTKRGFPKERYRYY